MEGKEEAGGVEGREEGGGGREGRKGREDPLPLTLRFVKE